MTTDNKFKVGDRVICKSVYPLPLDIVAIYDDGMLMCVDGYNVTDNRYYINPCDCELTYVEPPYDRKKAFRLEFTKLMERYGIDTYFLNFDFNGKHTSWMRGWVDNPALDYGKK